MFFFIKNLNVYACIVYDTLKSLSASQNNKPVSIHRYLYYYIIIIIICKFLSYDHLQWADMKSIARSLFFFLSFSLSLLRLYNMHYTSYIYTFKNQILAKGVVDLKQLYTRIPCI